MGEKYKIYQNLLKQNVENSNPDELIKQRLSVILAKYKIKNEK